MLEVQRHHQFVRWYLGSISVVGITVLLGFAAARAAPGPPPPAPPRGGRTRARDWRGDTATVRSSAFAIGEDVDYFFSANRRAVIAYRFESDVLLVIGDPIGPRRGDARAA